MQTIVLSILSGFILGSIFSLINLPIPAPPNLGGVMGVVGIYLGYLVVNYFS
ncbi:XapX domain-containing protein [Fuchsiella alkaliacetigena]|uniref:XapX domain-containing protein n=1 Tax=Fuchsiella alkaliacetigena TaxID=957042 RepID=UPI00200B95C0|nr:DUF1427 family protein [Fuchsiella alkaliacetigena]MCK8824609.1 DUF1427 family protein [Fuchsiella alkaliacetigena]